MSKNCQETHQKMFKNSSEKSSEKLFKLSPKKLPKKWSKFFKNVKIKYIKSKACNEIPQIPEFS